MMKQKRERERRRNQKKEEAISNQQLMGRVEELFTCGPELHVYGENNEIRWKIIGEIHCYGFCSFLTFRLFILHKNFGYMIYFIFCMYLLI